MKRVLEGIGEPGEHQCVVMADGDRRAPAVEHDQLGAVGLLQHRGA